MQVYIIAKTERRAQALQRRLLSFSVPSLTRSAARLPVSESGIYVFLCPPAEPAIENKMRLLAGNGSLVLAVGSGKPELCEIPGMFAFPAETPDASLAALVSVLIAYKDKEAHFDWITDELTKVNNAMAGETKRLKMIRDELDAKNRKMTEELALANVIQNSFLPKQFPGDVPMNFCHKYIPHEYIGGDFFEIIQIDDRHVGILIADVSGHGVSSALITAMLKSTFLHASQDCLSPALVLKRINSEFTRVMRTEHYITAFYSIIDTVDFLLLYAVAGHPRQLVLRRDGDIEAIGANGFFLGMFDSTVYEERSITLEAGDRLLYYTDGLIECPDNAGKHFGQENLIETVRRHWEEDIETLSKNLIVELIAYMAESRFPDDITLLISEIIPLL
jgi:serine phosphatase RsbU (regulator of sigma subunit)